MKKEAILLAGGLGTRLAHVVTDTQKVMAPVGGIPFIQYIFDSLIESGFDKLILAVSFREETVRNYFGNSYKSAEIVYSEETEPLGTGGAIKKALSFCEGNCIPVINGDTFFETDINRLIEFHKEHNAEITLTVKEMENFSRYGTVSFESNGKVTAFHEKQAVSKGFINGGIYCINKGLFDNSGERFSFEKDIMEPLTFDTFAFFSDGYFIDIGIPEDYFRAQTDIPLLAGKNVFRAAFIDRDGTINIEKHHLYKKEDFEFISGVERAIEKLREHGYLIIVITNQAGVAKGLYTEEDVNALHEYIKDTLREKAYIDAFYFCPYHEEAVIEKYRKKSPCRKPAPGMIELAISDFAEKGIIIDKSRSVIIGDTENDILTGKNAGLKKNILVRTGHGAQVQNTVADIVAENLPDAVQRLLENEAFLWE